MLQMPAEKIRTVTKAVQGRQNRPNKQKYNRNKDYKNKTIIKITTGTKTMEALIHSNERLDDLCRKGYRLIQDPKLFCFGIDAVLLSDYAKVKRGERAVDLCTGNGVIPIILRQRITESITAGLSFSLSVQTWREEV